MSLSDYIGVTLALSIGLACIVFRKRMAISAVRSPERIFGVRYDPRSFEFGFGAGGIAFIVWAVFMVVGAFVFVG